MQRATISDATITEGAAITPDAAITKAYYNHSTYPKLPRSVTFFNRCTHAQYFETQAALKFQGWNLEQEGGNVTQVA